MTGLSVNFTTVQLRNESKTDWVKKTAERILRSGSQTSPDTTPGAETFLIIPSPYVQELPEPY